MACEDKVNGQTMDKRNGRNRGEFERRRLNQEDHPQPTQGCKGTIYTCIVNPWDSAEGWPQGLALRNGGAPLTASRPGRSGSGEEGW